MYQVADDSIVLNPGELIAEFEYDIEKDQYIGRHKWGGEKRGPISWGCDNGLHLTIINNDTFFMVDNNGVMIAHPINWVNVGRSLEFFAFEPTVIQAVKDGREASQIKISKTTGNRNYYQFVPVKIGSIYKPWSLVISLRPDWLNGRGPKVSW
ncbi:MAG: hypothetical protein PVH87_17890 [Desulfobacteraceae bacterium]